MFESTYIKALLAIVVGAGIGIAYSRLSRCSTGACPLTSNWWLAGLYGAALGAFVVLGSTGASSATGTSGEPKVPASQSQPAATQPEGDQKMPKHVESVAEFERDVIRASRPVLVDFYATWCGPCRFLTPVMEQIAAEQAGKVDVVKIDVDKVMELATQYRIQGVPTVMLFDGGKPVKTFVGVRSKAEYLAAIEQATGTR